MGQLLGIGITDYPFMMRSDLTMSRSLQLAVTSERIHDNVRGTESWPQQMRAAWGQDMGKAAARAIRSEMIDDFRMVRATLDAFNPDVIIMVAKDHHETVSRDYFLPYWAYNGGDVKMQPFGPSDSENIFGLPADTEVAVQIPSDYIRRLTNGLREQEVVLPVVSQQAGGLAHTMRSGIVHLNWDNPAVSRFKMLPLAINAFGTRARGMDGMAPLGPEEYLPLKMNSAISLGRAIARVVQSQDQRVAIVAAAGWSHANNTSWERSWLWPDVESDRALFRRWSEGGIDAIGELTDADMEEHGHWEMLVWGVLSGAMAETGSKIELSRFHEGWIFNSNWVTTIFSST